MVIGMLSRFTFVLFVVLAPMPPGVWGQSPPPERERAALVRVVTQWDSSCDASNRYGWGTMLNDWYEDITDSRRTPWGHGTRAFWRDGFYQNGSIVDSDFTDPGAVAWGNDFAEDRVDEPDAILVGLHGSPGTGDRWNAHVREDEAGDGNCVSWQGHMRLGNEDLEFLHLSSCHSMNEEVWWDEWQSSFHRLHQVNGFHGVSYVARAYGHRYGGFADDAFEISIADAWIDNLYKYRSRGRNMCPVARGVGFGTADLWNRMDHERYDWVFSDPDGAYAMGVVYISGCDPSGAPALPD